MTKQITYSPYNHRDRRGKPDYASVCRANELASAGAQAAEKEQIMSDRDAVSAQFLMSAKIAHAKFVEAYAEAILAVMASASSEAKAAEAALYVVRHLHATIAYVAVASLSVEEAVEDAIMVDDDGSSKPVAEIVSEAQAAKAVAAAIIKVAEHEPPLSKNIQKRHIAK